MTQQHCPLCDRRPRSIDAVRNWDAGRIACDTCGIFDISGTLMTIIGAHEQYSEERFRLSAAARELCEAGRVLSLDTTNIDDVLASAPVPATPFAAMDRILLYILHHSVTPASSVVLGSTEYPIAVARDAEEFSYYLAKLRELQWIEATSEHRYRLMLEGWRHLEQLRTRARVSDQAFVAMWFSDEMKPVWESGIAPALIETGYRPIRVDYVEHTDRIDDRIIAEIRRSGLLVADFTGHRGGVYVEAGFAMGLGIPIIWTCREDQIDSAHFDTRQYNHLTWSSSADLKSRLITRISALGRHRTNPSLAF